MTSAVIFAGDNWLKRTCPISSRNTMPTGEKKNYTQNKKVKSR